jgi:hypothetical protein
MNEVKKDIVFTPDVKFYTNLVKSFPAWVAAKGNIEASFHGRKFAPCGRTIKLRVYNNDYNNTHYLTSLFLYFPYMYFFKISLKAQIKIHCFVVGGKDNPEDSLKIMNMPNTNAVGKVCLGELTENKYNTTNDFTLDQAINTFWFSEFVCNQNFSHLFKTENKYGPDHIELFDNLFNEV